MAIGVVASHRNKGSNGCRAVRLQLLLDAVMRAAQRGRGELQRNTKEVAA
jgi:hypothetical protein